MQVEIISPVAGTQLPAVVWNYEALKKELTEQLQNYKGAVYAPDQISMAKADRAKLNKVSTALNDRKIDIKKQYLEPYSLFETQIKELVDMVKQCSDAIDAQVKAAEEAEKEKKQEEIQHIYVEQIGDLADLVSLEKLQSAIGSKWLNKGTSFKAIEDEMQTKIAQVRTALTLLADDDAAITAEVKGRYLETLDLQTAVELKDRIHARNAAIAKQQAEAELRRAAAVNPVQVTPIQRPAVVTPPAPQAVTAAPQKITISFRVEATPEQLTALKQFLINNQIKFGRV